MQPDAGFDAGYEWLLDAAAGSTACPRGYFLEQHSAEPDERTRRPRTHADAARIAAARHDTAARAASGHGTAADARHEPHARRQHPARWRDDSDSPRHDAVPA